MTSYNVTTESVSSEPRQPSIPRKVLAYWRTYIIILIPLLFLPLPLVWQSPKMNCAYIMVIMATYWVTEAIPIAVTSLIPIVLVPLMGIMPSKQLCPNYMKDTICLFMGGLMVAVAVEHWNLHKRIALKVLVWVGTAPRWLMLGFMLPTWFLSMWISNTATTAMMIPIVAAVLEEIRRGETAVASKRFSYSKLEKANKPDISEAETLFMENQAYQSDEKNSLDENNVIGGEENHDMDTASEAHQKLCKAMSLSVAYAANCGGIATLTGTGPNLVLKGQLDLLFGEDVGLSFSSWMAFGLPVSFISLFVAWVWLQILFMGCINAFQGCCKQQSVQTSVKNIIREEYRKLGPWSFAEISVLTIFIVLAVLWFTRSPGFMPGWGDLFPKGYATDATAAVFIAIFLFMFPSSAPRCWGNHAAPVKPILTWDVVTHKLPWSVVLLLGGGFALADASKESGLSEWVGEQLVVFEVLPPAVIALLISAIIAGLTEVTSNTATATLMLPIIADLSTNIGLNPLFLMLSATVSASFAFMLPVATPPNAIVFSYGHIRIKDMVMAGIVMNILCVLIVTLGVTTWGTAYFHLDEFPHWANSTLHPITTVSPLNCTF